MAKEKRPLGVPWTPPGTGSDPAFQTPENAGFTSLPGGAPPGTETEGPPRAPLGDLRVLFVEDEEEDGQSIIESLNALGVKKIVWVRSAVEALFQLREDKKVFPDVLLTELVLAGTNGIQLISMLRSDTDTAVRTLPAIAITGADSTSVFRRATQQAISGYLRKPITQEALHAALLRAQDRQTMEGPQGSGRSWADQPGDTENTNEEASNEDGTDTEKRPRSFFGWLASLFFPGSRASVDKPPPDHIDLSA